MSTDKNTFPPPDFPMMFSLFRKRYRSRELMPEGMDTHCHLLPGVDDGIPNVTEALKLIKAMKSCGLKGCFCTPHISLRFPNNTRESILLAFRDFQEHIGNKHPDFILKPSAEYMLDERFPELLQKGDLLTWESPDTLLVELSVTHPIPGWADILHDLLRRGYTPVLAHPERYHLHLSTEDLRHLHRLGIRFQGNVGSLAGHYGSRAQELCGQLYAAGFYTRWGSDAHRSDTFQRLPLRS